MYEPVDTRTAFRDGVITGVGLVLLFGFLLWTY